MGVTMTADDACTERVVTLIETDDKLDDDNSGNHYETVTSEVGNNGSNTAPTLEHSESEIILQETIFCRQVDTLTYIDGPDEPALPEGVDPPAENYNKGCDGIEQIRTMHDPENGKTNAPATARVSAEAVGNIDDKIDMPKTKGAYVLGYINDVGCPICVDTGCTRTTISERLYYRIPRERCPL